MPPQQYESASYPSLARVALHSDVFVSTSCSTLTLSCSDKSLSNRISPSSSPRSRYLSGRICWCNHVTRGRCPARRNSSPPRSRSSETHSCGFETTLSSSSIASVFNGPRSRGFTFLAIFLALSIGSLDLVFFSLLLPSRTAPFFCKGGRLEVYCASSSRVNNDGARCHLYLVRKREATSGYCVSRM